MVERERLADRGWRVRRRAAAYKGHVTASPYHSSCSAKYDRRPHCPKNDMVSINLHDRSTPSHWFVTREDTPLHIAGTSTRLNSGASSHVYFAMLPIITLTYTTLFGAAACLTSSHGGRSVMSDSSPTSNMTTIDNYYFHTFDIMGKCNTLR
ncbi:hypothetical protein BJV78DRAFT_1218632 [Lactifluus subvellereus]|nr:hypothetical protein BJV78DRAFT_1218632 [Lactifluus subvellereus]